MEPSRVVEILQDGKSRGSGYLITPRGVLTARHVAKPGSVGTVCMVHPLCGAGGQAAPPAEEPRPQPVPAKVGWVSAKHDLALIEITGDPFDPPNAATIPLGEIPNDGMARQTVGSGFPAAAGADQRTIIGKLTWVLTARRRFDIDVTSAIPREWTKWGGFSGAAIFADNLLVGVVRTVDENWNGGVLEATPAVWLLDDSSFKKYFEDAGLSIPNRLDAGAVDRIMPLDFEADVSIEGTLRFSPRNPRVPFIGRDAELRALDDFVTAEPGRPFAWWLVTGGGGVGKTRLARELCRRLVKRRQGWRVGFLPRSFKADPNVLNAWHPQTQTLIVADYVMNRVDEIRKLAVHMAHRDGLPPLRLLLLEREAGRLLENQFLGSDQSGRGVIEGTRHRPDPPILSGLDEGDIWALVEPCPWRTDATRVPIARDEFFRQLNRLDRQRRPLVAMILADSLVAVPVIDESGDLEKLLKGLLKRDRDHLWPAILNVADKLIGAPYADVVIAFATMVNGLGRPELDTVEKALGASIGDDILLACGDAVGKPLESNGRIERLEPDLIGEFFVLETLRPKTSLSKPPHHWLPEAAWRGHGREMFDFVIRAKQTFPEHPALPEVDITVEGVPQSWFLASLYRLSGTSLAEGFDRALKWLRPRTQLDPGAALAFADLSTLGTSPETAIMDPSVLIEIFETLRELQEAHPNYPELRVQAVRASTPGVGLGSGYV